MMLLEGSQAVLLFCFVTEQMWREEPLGNPLPNLIED